MPVPDRRVQRTRKTLHQALMSLVVEKPYDAITVQEVLDRADIGRSTFYTHFRDKDELLMSGVRELHTTLSNAQSATKGPESILAFSRAMFEHAQQFRKVYHALVTTSVWPHVQQRVRNVLADLVRRECATQLKSSRSKVPPELFIHYVSATMMAVLTWWVDHRNALSAEEIDDVFRALVMPAMRSVLR